MPNWFEKQIAYRVKETFDPKLIEDVNSVLGQHDNELNEAWRLTNQQVRENLITAFRKELEQWPRELSELSSKKIISALKENLITSIKIAYAGGYMMGKGWISTKHLAAFNLYLGDKLARDIRSTLKGAKSKGIAFASAFAAVAAEGHLAALGR